MNIISKVLFPYAIPPEPIPATIKGPKIGGHRCGKHGGRHAGAFGQGQGKAGLKNARMGRRACQLQTGGAR